MGLVYVFELKDGLWQEEVVIAPPNNELNQVFSHDIAVKDEFLVIGSQESRKREQLTSTKWNLIPQTGT